MNITNPIPTQFPSTYTLNLSTNAHTLFNLKIIVSNPNVAQTITFYNQNGSIEGQPITLSSSVEIKLRYINFSKITFSDVNAYNIFASIQTLSFNTSENLDLYMSDADFNIVPINNADIIKPLDANGYVETDDIGLNGKIAKLNQDASGNIGANFVNAIPTGANAIGTVGVTSLPAIPAGANAIGSIIVSSITKSARNPSSLTASLTTAATAQVFTATSTLVRKAWIKNTSASDTVNIGTSTVQNISIAAGSGYVIEMNGSVDLTDLSTWYFNAATAGDSISVVYL